MELTAPAPWELLAFHLCLLTILSLALFRPSTRADWWAWAAPFGFVLALSAHRYGFGAPIDGELEPHHLLLSAVLLVGLAGLGAGWATQWTARCEGRLAVSGVYARLRHPQHAGSIVTMLAVALLWPSVFGAALFVALVGVHARWALGEEAELERRHGEAWRRYAASTPRWWPLRLHRSGDGTAHSETGAVTPASERSRP